MNGLEITVIIIFAIFGITGYITGFLRMVYSLAAWILVLVFVTFVTPYAAYFLETNTGLKSGLEEWTTAKIWEFFFSSGKHYRRNYRFRRWKDWRNISGKWYLWRNCRAGCSLYYKRNSFFYYIASGRNYCILDFSCIEFGFTHTSCSRTK